MNFFCFFFCTPSLLFHPCIKTLGCLTQSCLPADSFWAGERPECLVGLHPEQWLLQRAACSTPRHFSLQAAGVLGRSLSSCCLLQRCLQAPESLQRDTP